MPIAGFLPALTLEPVSYIKRAATIRLPENYSNSHWMVPSRSLICKSVRISESYRPLERMRNMTSLLSMGGSHSSWHLGT